MKSHRPIKRSKTTALLLMSTAPLWLTACGEKKAEGGLYTSVEACIEATGEPSTCRVAFKQASEQAAETAPQYANVEECAKDYPRDQCVPQQTQSGSSFIGPMMAGFFLARMLGGNNAGLQSQPAFKDNTNNWAKPTVTPTPGNTNCDSRNNSNGNCNNNSSHTRAGTGGLATASRIGEGKAGLAPVDAKPNQPSPSKATTTSRGGFGARAAGAGGRGAAS